MTIVSYIISCPSLFKSKNHAQLFRKKSYTNYATEMHLKCTNNIYAQLIKL